MKLTTLFFLLLLSSCTLFSSEETSNEENIPQTYEKQVFSVDPRISYIQTGIDTYKVYGSSELSRDDAYSTLRFSKAFLAKDQNCNIELIDTFEMSNIDFYWVSQQVKCTARS